MYDGWELLRDGADPERDKVLGRGGQGTVYLARSPGRASLRSSAAGRARGLLGQIPSGRYEPKELAQCLAVLSNPDPLEDLGALKVFNVPSDDREEEAKAFSRLETEIRALEQINHPAVLRLLHSNIGNRFIVTEYHPRKTVKGGVKLDH
jgi:serine/threonine protein kinase